MTFEVFKRGRAAKTPLLVTVQENGVLRLNAAAYRAIDQPTYVHLLVDEERRQLAIRPVGASSEVTFRTGGSGMISCTGFIRHVGLVAGGSHVATVVGDLLVVSYG